MSPGTSASLQLPPRIRTGSPPAESAEQQLDALTEERTRRFFQHRLRFSGLALAATASSLLIIRALPEPGTVWVVLTSVLVTCLWCLNTQLHSQQQPPRAESALQGRTLAVFFFTFAAFALLSFGQLEASSRDRNLAQYLLATREVLFPSVILLLIYGLFIPSRWRRTAQVGCLLALVPGVSLALSLLIHASRFKDIPSTFFVRLACEDLFLLSAAVVLASTGTFFNCRLRDRRLRVEELGPYRLKRPLGSGGMGDVYLAEHRLLKRLCAIKLIHPDKAGDARMKSRFEREVHATAALTHLNTVEIYDYGTTRSGRFYYAMEFLEGLNLDQLVRCFGPMPPSRVIFILRQICGALHEAAVEGLVHRDIKPSNIFLAERGSVYDVAKLLDFGLVQPALREKVGMRRAKTQIEGSPAYMCPEQASGMEPDCRGDLYSLGAVAWFLLTGHPPFRDENPVMLIVAHATCPVPDFSESGVTVPDDLAAIVKRCLAKEPEDRFASPRDLLIALESCSAASDWTWQCAETWWKHNYPIRRQRGNASESCALDSRNPQGVFGSEPTDPSEPTMIFHHTADDDSADDPHLACALAVREA